MNRRATLEWNLETIGKLIIAAIVLTVIVFLSIKLVGLFTGGNAEHGAQRNFELLTARITDAENTKQPTSVILQLPDLIIVGFSANDQSIPIGVQGASGAFQIKRQGCDNGVVCVCLYKLSSNDPQGQSAFNTIECTNFKNAKTIVGTDPALSGTVSVGKVDVGYEKQTYYFVLNPQDAPKTVKIIIKGDPETIILDTTPATQQAKPDDNTGQPETFIPA